MKNIIVLLYFLLPIFILMSLFIGFVGWMNWSFNPVKWGEGWQFFMCFLFMLSLAAGAVIAVNKHGEK